MKNKKNVVALSALSTFVVIGIACAIPLSINAISSSKATEADNAIVFNSGRNVITTSPIVTSDKNSSFTFSFSNVIPAANKWQTVKANGYFFTTSDTSTDENAIHDMKTITFKFANADQPFSILFSRNGSFKENHCWSRSYITKTDGLTIDFEGHPRYFKFLAGSSDIDIIDMKITYGCDAGADNSWDNAHGVHAVSDMTTNTLTYGLYPQTHVKNPEQGLIDAGSDKENEEYFWYNDEYYVKDTGNPDDSDYTFSDGVEVEENITYYFKCEPIKWNIKGTATTTYTIDCANLLYAHRFAESSNVYADSEIRTWLNGEFYNKAFFLNPSLIRSTNLTDVGVTGDKVWIGSKDQYDNNGWYASDEARKKQVSDFSLCNHSLMYKEIRTGNYWSRTPRLSETPYAYYVYIDGSITNAHVEYSKFSVSPCLTISINENKYYQEVDYIQSSGTQYIDVGVKFNRSQPSAEIKFHDYSASAHSQSGNLFGCYNGSEAWTNGWGLYNGGYGSTNQYWVHYNSNTPVDSTCSSGIVTLDRNKLYYNGTKIHTQGSVDSYQCNNTLYLLSGNFGTTKVAQKPSLKLDYFKFWLDSQLVRDMIPCVLITDIPAYKDSGNVARNEGTVGVWDKITDKFYANIGTGSFTYPQSVNN